ncbi:protein COBRA [Trifolium repens]|nr:protein COBRA [Trifolium repens]
MQADPTGYAQTELFFSKGQIDVYFQKRLSLPRTIYFNGDSCVMPPRNDSLVLPNAGTKLQAHFFAWMMSFLFFRIGMFAGLDARRPATCSISRVYLCCEMCSPVLERATTNPKIYLRYILGLPDEFAPIRQQWKRPSLGWWKCNVYARFYENTGHTSWGRCIHNDQGGKVKLWPRLFRITMSGL